MEQTQERIKINLIDKYNNSTIREEFEKFKKKLQERNNFSDENKSLNLKIGDVVTFIGGYDSDIEFTSEILGFTSEGKAFVLWDCFWLDIDLIERRKNL